MVLFSVRGSLDEATFHQAIETRERRDLAYDEALDDTARLSFGRSFAGVPASWMLVASFLLLLLVSAILFLATASYARKETVRGVVRPMGGDLRVAPSTGGILTSVLVREGAVVARGTPLAVVSTSRKFEGGETAYGLLLRSLSGEEDSLRSRLAALKISQTMDGEVLREQIEALELERGSTEAMGRAAEERLKIASERLDVARRLDASGFISRDEMRRREDSVIIQEQAGIQARVQIARLVAQLSEMRARERQLPFSAVQERGQLEAALSAISQRRAEAEAQKGYVLEAPVQGRVTALRVVQGQSVASAQVLMTITPPGAPLVAEIYVPSRAIGFIKSGQEVRLLVDAFPYQRFGPLFGRVASISESVLKPDEVGASAEIKEPVYVVTVTVDTRAREGLGRSIVLQAGMALSADIILERRSFAAWLLEPALAVRERL